MQQPAFTLETGTRVRTIEKLDTTTGMIVRPEFLAARKPNTEGTIGGCVPGHGGDVYWVDHPDTSRAAYCFTEFDTIGE